MEVEFSAVDGDPCDFTWRMLSRNRGWMFRHTLLPLARRIMKKRAADHVKRLKKKMEMPERQNADA